MNLLGPMRLCRAFGRRMMDGGGGSMINVVSGEGFTPAPAFSPYNVSKAALWILTCCLAMECAPTVGVNALCPGTMTEDGVVRSEALRRATPLARGA